MNIKLTLRLLRRNLTLSVINLFGLSVGLISFIFIYQYIFFELSFDSYHTKNKRIYRLTNFVKTPSESLFMGATLGMGPAIKNEYPSVEKYARILPQEMLVERGTHKFKENILVADPSLFEIFSFELTGGNALTALEAPRSAVISAQLAKKYFGDANAIGKTLTINGEYLVTVTGILKTIPSNSHFQSNIILSMKTLSPDGFTLDLGREWMHTGPSGTHTYLLLKEGVEDHALQTEFKTFVKKYTGMIRKEDQAPVSFELSLEPLSKIYLNSKYGSQYSGNKNRIYIFTAVAMFILIIASINFINIAIATAAERAKEVSIQKIIGSSRMRFFWQFLGESVLLAMIAFFISVVGSELLSPIMHELAGDAINPSVFNSFHRIEVLFATALFTGIVAGIYPALVISDFKPVTILRGRFETSSNGVVLRKILVTLQFTVSIFLIIGTLVIYSQLNFLQTLPLGYEKEHKVVVDFDGNQNVNERMQPLKQALGEIQGVKSFTFAESLPGKAMGNRLYEVQSKNGDMRSSAINNLAIENNFFNIFGVKLLAGRDLLPGDKEKSVIVNEALVAEFGYNKVEEIIGKKFIGGDTKGTVVGVVKNFHFSSLREEITPILFRYNPNVSRFLIVNIHSGNTKKTLTALKTEWENILPGYPFNYYFLEEVIDNQYRAETKFGQLFNYFSVCAILISCLGLLGLVTYTCRQKAKEVGIRKVLGASIFHIYKLLSQEFLVPLIVAFLIACPLTWIAMNRWLKEFPYRIDQIPAWIFLVTGLFSISLALATVSFKTVSTALVSPVKSLKP